MGAVDLSLSNNKNPQPDLFGAGFIPEVLIEG